MHQTTYVYVYTGIAQIGQCVVTRCSKSGSAIQHFQATVGCQGSAVQYSGLGGLLVLSWSFTAREAGDKALECQSKKTGKGRGAELVQL